MFSTPQRKGAPNPLMDFSPNLSPISLLDASVPFMESTPERPARFSHGPFNSGVKPSMQPFLPGIAEEGDSASSLVVETNNKPAPTAEASLLRSVSLLNLTPQRHIKHTDNSNSISFLPDTPVADHRPAQLVRSPPLSDTKPRPSSYDREATRALLQSVQESCRRWKRRVDAEDQRRAAAAAYATDATDAAKFISNQVPMMGRTLPPEPSLAPPLPPGSPAVAQPSLPVGSLYALVLDTHSNPVLVPIQAPTSPDLTMKKPPPVTPTITLASHHAPHSAPSSSVHWASVQQISGSTLYSPQHPLPASRSGPASSVTPQGGASFLKHSSPEQRKSFVHMESQLQRALADEREDPWRSRRPLDIVQDVDFQSAYQTFYTPSKAANRLASSLPSRERMFGGERALRSSFPLASASPHPRFSNTSPLAMDSLLGAQDGRQAPQGSEFWREKLQRRSFAALLLTPEHT